jgi:diguanylate cyclase (GGDEF)-like protein
MIPIPGIQVEQLVHQSENSLVYRGYRLEDKLPVVIKTLVKEHPSIETIVRFRREYQIAKKLDLARVIRVHSLEKVAGLPVIVMEDGGESLEHFLADYSLDLDSFFEIALQLTETLAQLHQEYIIHKDISPSNILWCANTREIKLIDFGISTELSRETVALKNPSGLEGTLSYISPEQTGRMNRAIDYRSDLYSLGATLYRLIAGVPCFKSDDPMELVHFHIAQQPVSPSVIRKEIPQVVSDIILKLMSKLVEDRYQSAAGVHSDLLKCRQQIEQNGRCLTFPLAQDDQSAIFSIVQKLYGREEEVHSLLHCFDRVSAGHREMLMVSGYSGMGKSSLIHEVQKPIVKKKGLFIEGKFDQFKRNIPYASIIQAFQELVRQLLTCNNQEIEAWRLSLLAQLGPNGKVIIDVIPDLELLIGKQPDIPELIPAEANNRFKLTFKNFVETFATEQHPLVVFLDDLQWADTPSLKLIENLLTDGTDRHLLFIGAYRDNEISMVHPLIGTQKRLEESGVQLRSLTLTPLKLEHVSELIQDTLHGSPARVNELAELCIEKTQGNPFFLNQFLISLYENQDIYFDQERAGWEWNTAKIGAMQTTDNVVDLMVVRLLSLGTETQTMLQTAACIGATFSLRLLSIATQKSAVEVTKALWPALQAGLMLPLNDAYKYVETEADEDSDNHQQFASTSTFKFLHDRVQQAAYSLIAAEAKPLFHLRTGRLLLEHAKLDEKEEQIFDIVNHLNLGKALIINEDDKLQLARLNFTAAEKALASSAYGPAFSFAKTGIEFLPQACWLNNYCFSFDLYLCALQSAYLTGEFEQMASWASLLLDIARDNLDRVKVFEVKIQVAMAINQPLDAIELALQVLAMLGVHFPQHLTEQVVEQELQAAVKLVSAYNVEDLLDLPEMTDPVDLAAMRVMNRIYSATYIAKPELMVLVSCRLTLLSLEKGNMPISSFAYSAFGLVLCGLVGDIDRGHRFGELALNVYDRYHLPQHKCRTYFMVYNFVWHWKRHIKETHKPLLKSYQSGLDTGELEFAGYAAFIYTDYCLFAGKHLGELLTESSHYISAIERIGQQTPLYYAQIVGQTVYNLQDAQYAQSSLLKGSLYDESNMLQVHQEANDQTALAFLYVHKLMLNYLLGNIEAALACSEQVEVYAGAITAMFHDSIYHFYGALTICSVWENLTHTEQGRLGAKLAVHRKKLQDWAVFCPTNHQHKHLLVEAEWSRINNDEATARQAYQGAIDLAQQHDFLPEEALAFELAAKFWYALEEHNFGELYARHAYHRYQLWGANAKVKQLAQALPVLRVSQESLPGSNLTHSLSHSFNVQGDSLDILSIMKASQAVAGEIVLKSLLEKIMSIVIENAGAQRGVLFLKNGNKWQIMADTWVGQDLSKEIRPIDLDSEEVRQLVPRSVIVYVARTQEHIVLKDAGKDSTFSYGQYVINKKVKSLLCMPIIYHNKMNGILYLENNLITGAFTEQRIELMTLLSSWMSISIDNAQLYQAQQAMNDNLEHVVAKRTQELSAALKDIESQRLQMYELAMKDQLTKLYNRHYLFAIADKVIREACRIGEALCVIVIDIDHFKKINDSQGHQVGDQVLSMLAELIMSKIDNSDVAARFGGEEFVILLRNCDLNDGFDKAEQLRQYIEQLMPLGIQITASFGISDLASLADDACFDTLFKTADYALYRAKDEGRNRVVTISMAKG